MIIRTWAQAKKLKVIRSGPGIFYQKETLDPGINFFVLMLEKLGATTHYSCEGHPNGFYILFSASKRVAHNVLNCGYFNVELELGGNWSLRIHHIKFDFSGRQRSIFFSSVAQAWTNAFGEIHITHPHAGCVVCPKQKTSTT